MAIRVRRGNKVDFDKSKMLPGEFGVAEDSQEAFVCFGAGITKKMATYEDYADMIDECVVVTQTAQGVVDSFNNLEIEKLGIDDATISLITGWSSDKISKHDTKDNVATFTEATTRDNIATGEKHSTIFSKVKKWFSDLKSVAFTGKYNDLTNVAIENPTTLPTASADTLGKIYRDGTGLKITFRSGAEGSYTYSWVPFISKDKVVNNFTVTEDGFVADARGLKTLKDGLNDVNNNLTPIKRNYVSYIETSYLDFNVYRVGKVAFVSAIFTPTQNLVVGANLFELEDAPMFLTRVDLSVYAEGSKRADLTLDNKILNQSIISSGTTITMNFSYIIA